MSHIVSSHLTLAKYSLSFLWVFTGLTSVFFAPSIGYVLLAKSNITGYWADVCVIGGSVVDIAIGIWILVGYQQRLCFITQVVIVIIFSILLSVLEPSYWLHPFGPLTKNIPIISLVYILLHSE